MSMKNAYQRWLKEHLSNVQSTWAQNPVLNHENKALKSGSPTPQNNPTELASFAEV